MKKWSNDLTDSLKQENFTSSRLHTGRYHYIPYLAFDNHTASTTYDGFQLHYPNNMDWLKIDFINPVNPSKITIQGNDDQPYLPKKIRVLMSDNDIDYVEIDIIDNIKNDNKVTEYVYKNSTKKYRFLKIEFLEFYSTEWLSINQMQFFETISATEYLINQNKNYYLTKSNFINLGQPTDNTQLENWYNKYGADDVNIITQNLNNKEFPMTKDENGIWKTDFELDMNEVIDNIELVDTDENNKSIKYNCNDYKILDLCDDQFKLTMCKTK
ncbi:cell adhesion protein [Clostridium botulinum]|nr:cell adhesion protein [Clostridium botulinum]